MDVAASPKSWATQVQTRITLARFSRSFGITTRWSSTLQRPKGWFNFGTAHWTSGRRAGIDDQILGHTRIGGVDIFAFAAAVGEWVVVGDALTALAGCDRSFSTCKARFANAANFRGFPHIPGNDFILGYPQPGALHDGAPLVA